MKLRVLKAIQMVSLHLALNGVPGAKAVLKWATEQRLLRIVGDRVDVDITFIPPEFTLPLHRAGDQATTSRCSTCDGGGCLDCTDPA